MRILRSGKETDLVDVVDPVSVMAARSWWSAETVVDALGRHGVAVDVPAVHQRRRRGRLLGARIDGQWRYAPCQFAAGDPDDDTAALIALLWQVAPGPGAEWLTRPIAALRGESPERVLVRAGVTQELWHAATEFVAARRAAADAAARAAERRASRSGSATTGLDVRSAREDRESQTA